MQPRRGIAGMPAGLARPAVRVGMAAQRGQYHRIEPALCVGDHRRISRQSPHQRSAPCARARLQPREFGPRGFRVDMIGRDRRNPAPIVDPRLHQPGEVHRRQIGRRLDVHVRPQHQPRRRDRPHQVFEIRLRRCCHRRAGLGAEVLDDDFLDVAVPRVEAGQREQCIEPLRARLTDADQQSAGERDRQFPCQCDRLDPRRRVLVGRAPVRPPRR